MVLNNSWAPMGALIPLCLSFIQYYITALTFPPDEWYLALSHRDLDYISIFLCALKGGFKGTRTGSWKPLLWEFFLPTQQGRNRISFILLMVINILLLSFPPFVEHFLAFVRKLHCSE